MPGWLLLREYGGGSCGLTIFGYGKTGGGDGEVEREDAADERKKVLCVDVIYDMNSGRQVFS